MFHRLLNSLVKIHNEKILDTLTTPLINIFAIEEYPHGLTQSKINDIRKKNYTDTGGLLRYLGMKVGARIMLTTNMDISDRLVNGQLGTVKHFTLLNGQWQIYILFDDVNAGNERKNGDNFARRIGYVPIEKTEAKFGISNKNATVVVTWTQFPSQKMPICF